MKHEQHVSWHRCLSTMHQLSIKWQLISAASINDAADSSFLWWNDDNNKPVIDDESMTCALLLMKESCRAIVFVFSLMARLTDSFNCFLFLCQLTAWFLFSYGRLVVDTRKLRKQLYCHFCCYHLWPQGCSLFSITGAKGNNRYYDSIWFLLISFFLLLTAGSLFVPGGC